MEPRSTGDMRAIDTFAHALAAVLTLAMWVIAHAHGLWRPWCGGVVTEQWPAILWAVDLSMMATVVGHAVLAMWRPVPLRRLVDVATAATGLIALLVTLRVWPFRFSLIFGEADVVLRFALSIAAFALMFAVVVNAVRLLAWPEASEPARAVAAPSEPRDVLVCYASKHGATAGIALHIANALRHAGLTVDVFPADEAPPLVSYRAVVVGSAVYYGTWRPEASRWLRTHQLALATRPVWLFSSGPTGKDLPADLSAWRFPKNLEPVAERIHPRDVVVFGGALDPEVLGWFERFVVGRVGAPMGDFRDWDAIDRWAASIAQALRPPLAAAG